MGDAGVEAAIEAVLAGDLEAYAVVVERCEGLLRAWLAPRCPVGIEVEEIAHAAFVAAYEDLGRYRPGTDFRTWLIAIARNRLLAEAKRQRVRERHRSQLANAILEQRQQQAYDETDADDLAHRLRQLRRCLGELPDQAADLVRLRYADNCDLATISRRTGRSLGAIKKAFHGLRRRLHDCVRDGLAGEAS